MATLRRLALLRPSLLEATAIDASSHGSSGSRLLAALLHEEGGDDRTLPAVRISPNLPLAIYWYLRTVYSWYNLSYCLYLMFFFRSPCSVAASFNFGFFFLFFLSLFPCAGAAVERVRGAHLRSCIAASLPPSESSSVGVRPAEWVSVWAPATIGGLPWLMHNSLILY